MSISIHKALAGLDLSLSCIPPNNDFISIHKALAGLDPILQTQWLQFQKFQSTRPSRASTFIQRCCRVHQENFNPQGPRGPRRRVWSAGFSGVHISIHKALAGLDLLSRFSAVRSVLISIHKALAGLDPSTASFRAVNAISIHKALAGLDDTGQIVYGGH